MSSGKIAVVSSASKLGGTELSALRICNLLKSKGHEVVYIAPGSILQDEMQGVKLLKYSISRKNPLALGMGLCQIARILKSENVAVAHCQDAFSCILVCYAKKLFKCNVRIIWHERGIRYKSYTTMAQKYSPMIDTIVCNSYYERTLLMMNQCDPEKIKVIYNAIEKQIPTKGRDEIRREIHIDPDDFVIGSVGRQTWDKGFNTLISAVSIAKRQIPNLKLMLVGDGIKRKELEQQAVNLGISDSVIFTGFRRDIPNLLAAMDAFSIPSWYEAFGNVTVEAMLAKKVVIASRVGGIPEVIQDGINGWLVPSADAIQLSDRIVTVFQDVDNNERMIKQAYCDACERYNFEKYYELITGVYFAEERHAVVER